MCNLNIIIKHNVDTFTNKSMPSFLMGITRNSYKGNDDGDGIFLNSDNILIKGKRKVNLYKYENQIKTSNFIVTHQRFTTSGPHVKYTQPFSNKDFILAHNGVISELAIGTKSDSYTLFKGFLKLFNKSKGNRNKRIVDAIKKSINNLEAGSYSIAIYDKPTKVLYYFKNSGTSIYFHRHKNILFITTNWNNDTFLKMLNVDFKDFDIDNDTIYKITIKNKIKIRKVGKLKQNNLWKNYYNDGSPEREEDYGNLYKPSNVVDDDYFRNYDYFNGKNDFLHTSNSKGTCVECNKRATNRFITTKEHICNTCLSYWQINEEKNLTSYFN